MTALRTLRNHLLYLECNCGHRGMVAVADLIPVHGEEATIDQVRRAARCSRCRLKGAPDLRIVWEGASAHALSAGHGQYRSG